jgi:hypothetical protein
MLHGSHGTNGEGPTPPAGESRSRAPRPIIDRKLIALGLVVASVTAGIILWATDRLSSRASAAEVERLRDEQSTIKQELAGMGAQLRWLRADVLEIKTVLWRLAARDGVVVPSLPTTQAPLAPPVAP